MPLPQGIFDPVPDVERGLSAFQNRPLVHSQIRLDIWRGEGREQRIGYQHHWFFLLLPFWLIAALGFRAMHPWAEQPALGEAATLFDWCLFVPVLYVLCYRTMPRRALTLRTLALVCSGIWIAGKIVPDAAETVLSELGWLRSVGVAVLVLFEGLALVAMLQTGDAAPLRQTTSDGSRSLRRR